MAVGGGNVRDESFASSGSLASNQFYIVKLGSAADSVALCTGASGGSAHAIGILQNDPGASQGATVRMAGISKCSAGGTISIGDRLTCSTGGQALAAGTTGQYVFATALSASTAAGQIITVDVMPGGIWMGSTA